MPLTRRRLLGATCALSAALLPALHARAADDAVIRVGSKIDTEGALLGNLIVLALQGAGFKVENRVSLGATQVVRQALLAGEIDLYPEYTGNGAFLLQDEGSEDWKSLEAGYARVRKLDRARNGIEWLTPAPANNTWVIAVRAELAAQAGLRSLDDLAAWLKKKNAFRLAASAEFVERPDALPAFQKAYGFTLTEAQLLVLAGGDTAATLRAAAEGTSGVNASMAYGTDGPVAALGLQVLTDPRAAQPVYAPAPTVRAATLKAHPGIVEPLERLFKTLDAPTLRTLNARIQLEGVPPVQVAQAWLKEIGLPIK